ncbi:hypothetical protein FOA43_003721 [Brettanomyces nanus]|uniref:Peroxin/Ferlin domain-containing protein n=1 Tax=Eeniella nana TaxID=13502 RepID=A0A875S7U3_EENNA|nr:uncharacterized protein FOA43_003721 [Brettanomyces nanus]QPG76335.1 hypothetical protein FOA43_003721 [Brettanomyces nanus]
MKYRVKSSNKFGSKVVEFEVFENQRRWFGVGWSDSLLPIERQHYTNEYLKQCCDTLDSYNFPNLPEMSGLSELSEKHPWKWMDEHWKIDREFCKGKDPDGWIYYDNTWGGMSYQDSISKFTRTRRLIRRALLKLV